MEIKTLNYTMRSTTHVVELARMAANMISNEKAVYLERKQPSKQLKVPATNPEPSARDQNFQQRMSEQSCSGAVDALNMSIKDSEKRNLDADKSDQSTLLEKRSVETIINSQMRESD